MAGNLLMSVSQNERELAIFRSRRMYQSDMDSNIATIRDRAMIEVARNMLLDGEPVEKIIKYTYLTTDEVEDLKRQLFQ